MMTMKTKTQVYTPKALANSSPGLERSENPGVQQKRSPNPERAMSVEPFQGWTTFR